MGVQGSEWPDTKPGAKGVGMQPDAEQEGGDGWYRWSNVASQKQGRGESGKLTGLVCGGGSKNLL